MDIPLQLDMDNSDVILGSDDPPALPLQHLRIKNPTPSHDLRPQISKPPPLKTLNRTSNGSNTMHSGFSRGSDKDTSKAVSNGNRKRLNSRSQVLSSSMELPEKRIQMQYLVTLIPLNDTFVTKNLLVPYFPDTLKLGRPAGSKVKPETNNGYFDSRVLSRNHALLYVDPLNGKLMIKDLGSSNGTFLNEQKIGQDPVELNIGDTIYLGFNIEVDTSHKKILAKVENINILPMKSKLLLGFNNHRGNDSSGNVNSPEYKHYNFVQLIFAASKLQELRGEQRGGQLGNSDVASFDNALFGDVNPMLDSVLLGLQPKSGGGIFNNAQVVNLTQLESAISLLLQCLLLVKQQSSTLNLLELFAKNYQLRLEELNKKYIDEEYDEKFKQCNNLINEKEEAIIGLNSEHEKYRKKTSAGMKGLEDEIDALRAQISMLTQRLHDEEDTRTHSTSSIYLIDEKPVVTPPVSDDDNDFRGSVEQDLLSGMNSSNSNGSDGGNEVHDAGGANGVNNDMHGINYDIEEENENEPNLRKQSQLVNLPIEAEEKSALLDSLDTFDNTKTNQLLGSTCESKELLAGEVIQAQEKNGAMNIMLHATAGLVLLILISFLSNQVSISHIGLT